jgi:CRISPR-associated protein Cas5t
MINSTSKGDIMLGLRVTVPIACFRKGLAREYLETEPIPPPATCYGLMLSLVGETKRHRHIGCRVMPVLVNKPEQSVVLRTVWRVKKTPLGSPGNTRPDYQQLLAPVELLVWLDSSNELPGDSTLEIRVRSAMQVPAAVSRFGGLSLGESTHLVDEVDLLPNRSAKEYQDKIGLAFVIAERGRLTLPVWVDHVGSAGTRYVTGNLVTRPVLQEPTIEEMPLIDPGD